MPRSIRDLQLEGKRIVVRADLDVRISAENTIDDNWRLKRAAKTITYILEQGGKPVVLSHLGRPQGPDNQRFSLAPLAEKMSALVSAPVEFGHDPTAADAAALTHSLAQGSVLLFENIRFHSGETSGDTKLASRLARLGDVFIQDAFTIVHRSDASSALMPRYFQERGVGLLIDEDLRFIRTRLREPARPFCVMLGGAGASDKVEFLTTLAPKIDSLMIGGTLANSFLAAQGTQMGRSAYSSELFPQILKLLGTLARQDAKVYLPVDLLASPSLHAEGLARAVPTQEIPADLQAFDIGPATRLLYREALHSAETALWIGPMGTVEKEEFSQGTFETIENLSNAHCVTIAAGGETTAMVRKMELDHKFDRLLTSGHGVMELLCGGTLPGLEGV